MFVSADLSQKVRVGAACLNNKTISENKKKIEKHAENYYKQQQQNEIKNGPDYFI